jgi:hypothetical protein
LAKHKKKKSPPTPDPEDSQKKENAEKKQDTPTENEETSVENAQTEEEKSETKQKLDKLFWLRIGLAVVAGIAATFIFDTVEGEERRWSSIGFMIIIFIVSIGIAKGMQIQVPRSDRKKLITTGLGSYIFLYLFMWIVSYTLVNVGNDTGTQIPFP